MSKLNIAIVSQDFLPNNGGIAIHVFQLCKTLADLGHEIYLFAGHSDQISCAYELPNNVHLIRNNPFKWGHWGQITNAIACLAALHKLDKTIGFDIVHWHNLVYESWMMRLFKCKALKVFTNHSSGYTRRLQSTWKKKILLPFLLGTADCIIVPSKLRLLKTQECYKKKIAYIANGVDTDYFTPRVKNLTLMNQLGIGANELVLITPVRAEYVKGVDRILSVLPELGEKIQSFKLLVFGNGREQRNLQNLCDQKGIQDNVVFLGGVAKEHILEYYSIADISIMMSRDEGGVPLSALESLSCGIPLIATNVGGLKDLALIQQGVSLIDSEKQLVAAIQEVSESTCANRMAAADEMHKKISADFSSSSAGKKTEQLYLECLASRENSRISPIKNT